MNYDPGWAGFITQEIIFNYPGDVMYGRDGCGLGYYASHDLAEDCISVRYTVQGINV